MIFFSILGHNHISIHTSFNEDVFFFLKSILVSSFCRQIWSLVCFNTFHHICSSVLRPVRSCWLVLPYLTRSLQLDVSKQSSLWCYSFCWTLFPTIHKHELPQKPLHHRRVSLLRTIDPRVLQRLLHEGIAWSSSHQCWLVQWFLEHNLLVFTDGGADDRSVLGQYFGLQREC